MSPWVSVCFLQTQSDERLLAAARLGHERAFETIVHRYRKPLLSYAHRLLPDARAEDALQQGLLQAWSALQRGADVQNARAWLYRVVHNAALDVVRKPGQDHEPLGHRQLSEPIADSEPDSRFAARDALAAFIALPENQREVLRRTAIEGDSHEQVASALGLSEGAVRGLVYRARVTLRAAASAVTPPPLVEWTLRAERSGTHLAQRLTGTGTGGGSLGLLALKGGAAAVTAGALAVGAAALNHSSSLALRAAHPSALGQRQRAPLAPAGESLDSADLASTRSATPGATVRSRSRSGRERAARIHLLLSPSQAQAGLGDASSAHVDAAPGFDSGSGLNVELHSSTGNEGQASGSNSDGGVADGRGSSSGSGSGTGDGGSGTSGGSGDGGSSGQSTQTTSDGGGNTSGSGGGSSTDASGTPGSETTTGSGPGPSATDMSSGSSGTSTATTTSSP